jgi:hypothetical protein
MKRALLPACLIILFLVISPACRKIIDYPDEPVVSFSGVTVVDSSDVLNNPVKRVTLTFHLTDGNGDIGLAPTDTAGPFHKDSLYYYNLIINEFTKSGLDLVPVPEPDGLKRYRIPDLTPSGQNKTLVADISVTIEYPYSEAKPLPFSEFCYMFHVVDRSLNISNTDTTSMIVW